MSDQFAIIAKMLLQNIELNKTIVIKTPPPEETKIPEELLRKLVSELESALLAESNFAVNLRNRLTTEEIWQEAIEFNNAEFQQLHKASQAEILLLLTPQTVPDGLELNASAYELVGTDAGRVLASTGAILLALDMQREIGVNLSTIDQSIEEIRDRLSELEDSGGLISDPDDFAEFLHNGRILSETGDIIGAIASFTQAAQENRSFVDPVILIADLLQFQFGKEAAIQYGKTRLSALDDTQERLFSFYLSPESQSTGSILTSKIDDPIALSIWLNFAVSRFQSLPECLKNAIMVENNYYCGPEIDSLWTDSIKLMLAMETAKQRVLSEIENGNMSNFFISPAVFNSIVLKRDYESLDFSAIKGHDVAMAFVSAISHYEKNLIPAGIDQKVNGEDFSAPLSAIKSIHPKIYTNSLGEPEWERSHYLLFQIALAEILLRSSQGALDTIDLVVEDYLSVPYEVLHGRGGYRTTLCRAVQPLLKAMDAYRYLGDEAGLSTIRSNFFPEFSDPRSDESVKIEECIYSEHPYLNGVSPEFIKNRRYQMGTRPIEENFDFIPPFQDNASSAIFDALRYLEQMVVSGASAADIEAQLNVWVRDRGGQTLNNSQIRSHMEAFLISHVDDEYALDLTLSVILRECVAKDRYEDSEAIVLALVNHFLRLSQNSASLQMLILDTRNEWTDS